MSNVQTTFKMTENLLRCYPFKKQKSKITREKYANSDNLVNKKERSEKMCIQQKHENEKKKQQQNRVLHSSKSNE